MMPILLLLFILFLIKIIYTIIRVMFYPNDLNDIFYENITHNEIKQIKNLAEQGDAEAQFKFGYIYDNGYGVKQDYEEAAKWYGKAAEQGYAEAQHNLGVMYYKGKQIEQNLLEAKKLFKQACDNGLQEGCKAYKILNEKGI